jgi:hypothetical protein
MREAGHLSHVGFEAFEAAQTTLTGAELRHMLGKDQWESGAE